MTRPAEYENLIKAKALETVVPTEGAIAQYLRNAQDYLASARPLGERLPLQTFTLAYEGYFQLVQAVLEHYQVRTKDAGRNLAIQRVSTDLKLGSAEFALVTRAHARRNATSCQSPFPPVSQAEADALLGILDKYIPAAVALTRPAAPRSAPWSPPVPPAGGTPAA